MAPTLLDEVADGGRGCLLLKLWLALTIAFDHFTLKGGE